MSYLAPTGAVVLDTDVLCCGALHGAPGVPDPPARHPAVVPAPLLQAAHVEVSRHTPDAAHIGTHGMMMDRALLFCMEC